MAKTRTYNGSQKGLNALGRIEAKCRAEYETKLRGQVDFLLQIGCDAFLMTAEDLFDLQPGRAVEAVNTYKGYIDRLMDHLIEDAKSDADLTYFWADLDRRLEQIVGSENFVPRELRYDEKGEKIFMGLFSRYVRNKIVLPNKDGDGDEGQ